MIAPATGGSCATLRYIDQLREAREVSARPNGGVPI
jgi:hypothetical protein